MNTPLDKRLNVFRPDRANVVLKGAVDATEYVTGSPAQVVASVVDMKNEPTETSEAGSQLLLGETVSVFEETNGWSWVQADLDRYVGYVPTQALGPLRDGATHVVVAPRTFVYSGPDLRHPVRMTCSMGSRLRIADSAQTRGTDYAVLDDGTAVIAAHMQPLSHRFEDYVAVAECFLETPYLWAGKSGFGLDCSGLVHLAALMCGHIVQRDSDMQAKTVGSAIEPGPDGTGLQRGDLVFWKGHVGVMTDAEVMLHASGHAMRVVREPLKEAVDRIAALYGKPTGYRRPGF